MSTRFFVDLPLAAGLTVDLPAETARHVQVLRLQPGGAICLFNGDGGEWQATVQHMGRRDVQVHIDGALSRDCELPGHVTLAIGMPANDRFEWLIEKATELGAHAIVPLVCERSVVRLDGERAERKRGHWLGVARAAAEQCGRTRVPDIAAPVKLTDYLRSLPASSATQHRWTLSLTDGSRPLSARLAVEVSEGGPAAAASATRIVLSGPEGGLAPGEETAAAAVGFQAVSLGGRVLRSETAPLAVLACLDGLQGLT